MRRRLVVLFLMLASLFAGGRVMASPDDGDDFSEPSGGGESSDNGSSGGSSDNSSSGGGSSDNGSSGGGSSDNGSTGGGDSGGREVVLDGGAAMRVGLVILGILVLIGGFWGFAIYKISRQMRGSPWTAGAVRDVHADLDSIKLHDPNFSVVLFEDFLYSLYATAQRARGAGTIEAYSTHFGPLMRAACARDGGLTEVRTIVIGSMRVEKVEVDATATNVQVVFVTNYTEVRDNVAASFAVRELWTLERARSAQSPLPSRARIEVCPSCGSPRDQVRHGMCAHCSRVVDRGAFDWTVVGTYIYKKEPRSVQLRGPTQNRDPSLHPTIGDPRALQRFEALCKSDPSITQSRFQTRLDAIFRALQNGWSSRQGSVLRPFVSDALFHKLDAQMQTYRELGIYNRLDGARATSIAMCRVTSDRFFDALTIRIFVVGKDYRVREDGSLYSGDPRMEHAYGEYWTLIRGSRAPGARDDRLCPACGGPLNINMAGACEHCSAHVTSGEFDWVLSRIEQDKSYRG